MKQRTRIYYSEKQKALMWDRWGKGESLHAIASHLIDTAHPLLVSAQYCQLNPSLYTHQG